MQTVICREIKKVGFRNSIVSLPIVHLKSQGTIVLLEFCTSYKLLDVYNLVDKEEVHLLFHQIDFAKASFVEILVNAFILLLDAIAVPELDMCLVNVDSVGKGVTKFIGTIPESFS